MSEKARWYVLVVNGVVERNGATDSESLGRKRTRFVSNPTSTSGDHPKWVMMGEAAKAGQRDSNDPRTPKTLGRTGQRHLLGI